MTKPWEYTKVLEQCISLLSKHPNRSADLGPVASKILGQFLLGEYFSTYNIHNMLKDKNLVNDRGECYHIPYKDVHKRIRRLDTLGLIARVPEDKLHSRTLHAPIFYRLTLGGLFNLLYKNRDIILNTDKEKIFQYHGENIIFKTFIHPFFEKSTLVGIKGSFFPEIIFSYLTKCCEIIDDTAAGLAKDGGHEVVIIPLFEWNEVPGDNDEEIVKTIGDEFEIEFTEKSKIEKIGNRTVRISDENHFVDIQVNLKKKTATMISDDGKAYNLATEKFGNNFILNKVGTFRHDIAFPMMYYRVKFSLLNLAISIIMGVRIGGSENDFIAVRPVLDSGDLKLLLKDTKTIDLIEETDKAYRIRYNLFVKSKKMLRTA